MLILCNYEMQIQHLEKMRPQKLEKKKCTKWLKKVQGRVKVEQPLSPTNNSIFYNFILLNIGAFDYLLIRLNKVSSN